LRLLESRASFPRMKLDARASIRPTSTCAGRNWRDIFYTSRDGLRLYARHYPAPDSPRRPVLCLPGLTRNARDFHGLATYLSATAHAAARDVYAVDYRGRGRSAHDPDWRNYSLQVEVLDVLDFMTLAGLNEAAVIGTSRGGLIAMIMATMRPGSLGAVVLNDVGPVLEREGLARIVAYTGRVPLPSSWNEAARLVQDMNRAHFPDVTDEQWLEIARQWFDDVNGKPAYGYDQNLGKAINLLNGPVPELWPQFEALSRLPTLAIRGELSDILTDSTLASMRLRHPRLETLTVHRQGHAPFLSEEPIQAAIAGFLASADPAATPSAALPATGNTAPR
jgi:pimeloyl-ACP methyl ester carboxylesterase